MSNQEMGLGEIEPNRVYTLPRLAKHLGVSASWVKTNLLESGEIEYATRGKFVVLIVGESILQWAKRESKQHTRKPKLA